MSFTEFCAIAYSGHRKRTIVEDWKNIFWLEAASFIGTGTVSECVLWQQKYGVNQYTGR